MPTRKPKPLSFTQRRWLRALADGKDPAMYLHGDSEHGGANGTIYSLVRRGYLSDARTITPAGLAAIGRTRARELVA